MGAILVLSLVATTGILYSLGSVLTDARTSPINRRYTLVAEDTRIQIDPWTYWNAWTFNGTVPGPTLRANLGDMLYVTLVNKQPGVHSLHFHQSGYEQRYDGTMLGAWEGMVTTGFNFTYVIKAERAGLFFYHCHSDYVNPVSVHIHQGLYGTLIVDDPRRPLPPAAKEYVLVLSETLTPDNLAVLTTDHPTKYVSLLTSDPSTHHIVNGASYPLTPTLTARTGETVRIYLVNLGEFQHSWHLHNHGIYVYKQMDYGRGLRWVREAVPGDVLSLDPGGVAIAEVEAGVPGTWMYHSHTVTQAEMGMMGLFTVTR